MGVHGRSSWESMEEEEEGWDSEVQTLSWEEEEGWEDERRSWELGAEEAESGAERVESERHCDGREGVFAVFPSGTSTPSFSSTSEPVASLAADWSVGLGGRAFGLEEADFIRSKDRSGSQSCRSVQQRRQFLGRGGFNSSHFAHRQ